MSFSIFAIVYATQDSFVYFIPPVMCFAIWIGLGVHGLMGMISRRFPKLGWVAGLLVLLVFDHRCQGKLVASGCIP